MPSRVLVTTLVLLTLAAPFSGCIGASEDPDEPVEPAATNDTVPTTALPDGRGEGSGLKETNKTETGVGGVQHMHDYWKGAERVVVFDGQVSLFAFPLYPDGEGSDPKSVEYIKLESLPDDETQSALVYEGTESVELLFSNLRLMAQEHPAAPGYFVQYRSAADADWRDPMPITFDTPMTIAVQPQETDMPHSIRSLWAFRITSERPDEASMDFTVSVNKGREVIDWPGHPDFYADNKTTRVVMDEHVTTRMGSSIDGLFLYDSASTWAHPDKLISWGTTDLVVLINVTRISNEYGAEAAGYFLEAHNATILGPEITFGDRYSDVNGKNDLKSYEFHIKVDDNGMDGPYQPSSRWGFRTMATFGISGLCPGCFPYEIEYDIKIIALSNPESLAG